MCNLPKSSPRNALVVVTLEPPQAIAVEVGAQRRCLVRIIPTVIGAVTEISLADAQVVVALEPRFRTVAFPGILRWAVLFVRHVSAIPIAIAAEVASDTMTAIALEGAVLALEPTAANFVGIVPAVILVVAPPPGRDAFAVGALKFGFGTLSVNALAHFIDFIAAVSTVIGEVTSPLLGHATVVFALEISFGIAGGTILWQFVAVIATIVFAIAEEPFRNTPF